ncbi:2-hydroxychromene-2-carboxylate isomerase [Sphingobium subterraneum]|uniref:2-hydroxychromene-2-carboxylate isomerase n=1 Tax=Sphingobium subterraneum TaxID=627688 RepID=A0A841IXF4_9SPHN|nr:2-hydroxychromene-2-carboxylate isomerase [Sphingobium subterraneum]MBB6123629.1 2-hydroxychromene-2-carboxylate isomerase [Sphingobium subterraneum]
MNQPDASNDRNPIDFYFDFISPFGWIGAERIGAVARTLDRTVRWHPFLLKVTVVDTMGLPPLLDIPLKGDYVRRDFPRSLRYHGLQLAEDPLFTFSPVVAARAALWVREVAPQRTEDLVLALYRAHWSEGRNISVMDTVLAVIAEQGLSPDDAKAALHSEPIKTALRNETTDAIAAGVFGSPTMIVDGEIFWGSDRIDMMAQWIATGGW